MRIPMSSEELEVRIKHLEEVNRFTIDALDMATSLGDFQSSIPKLRDPSAILKETGSRVKRLIAFRAIAFYLVDVPVITNHYVGMALRILCPLAVLDVKAKVHLASGIPWILPG